MSEKDDGVDSPQTDEVNTAGADATAPAPAPAPAPADEAKPRGCECPPPAPAPVKAPEPDARLKLLQMAADLVHSPSRRLLIEYLRLRRMVA